MATRNFFWKTKEGQPNPLLRNLCNSCIPSYALFTLLLIFIIIIVVHAHLPSFSRYDIFTFQAQSRFKQAAIV